MAFNRTKISINSEDLKTQSPYDENMETTLQRLDVLEDALMVVKDVDDDQAVFEEAKLYNETMLVQSIQNDVVYNDRAEELRRLKRENRIALDEAKYKKIGIRIRCRSDRLHYILSNTPKFVCSASCPFGSLLSIKRIANITVALFSQGFLVSYYNSESCELEMRDFEVISDKALQVGSILSSGNKKVESERDLHIFFIDQAGEAFVCRIELKAIHRRAWKYMRHLEVVRRKTLVLNDIDAIQNCIYCAASDLVVFSQKSVFFALSASDLEIKSKLDIVSTLRLSNTTSGGDANRISALSASPRGKELIAGTESGCLIEIRLNVDKGSHVQVHASLNYQYQILEPLKEEDIAVALDREIENQVSDEGNDGEVADDGVEKQFDENAWKKEIKFGFSCAEITSIGLYCEGEDVVGAVVGCKDGSTHVRRTFNHEFISEGVLLDREQYMTGEHICPVQGVCVSPELRLATTIDEKNVLRVWNLSSLAQVGVAYLEGFKSVKGISLLSKPERVVLMAAGQISLWSIELKHPGPIRAAESAVADHENATNLSKLDDFPSIQLSPKRRQ